MADGHYIEYSLDEKYEFKPELKKKIFTAMAVGVVLLVIGIIINALGVGEHHAEPIKEGAEQAKKAVEHHYHWTTRLWANFWMNGVFFTGLAVLGTLFVAIQYMAHVGWSAVIRRVAEAFGSFLPYTAAVMLVTFLLGGHDLFHWTHADLYEKGGKEFDAILNGKKGFFFWPLEGGSFPFLWFFRFVVYFTLWFVLYRVIKNTSALEDGLTEKGNFVLHEKNLKFSAVFILVVGISSSTSSWDWVMSIDPHWFSTLFGWYNFASLWVTTLSVLCLTVILLKEQGYLKMVNENHLHDLGKFMFGFSVFWAYLWYSQYNLISYANQPEEIAYYLDRTRNFDNLYTPYFFVNIFMNFFFPFLFLMTRDAKRRVIFLKIAACGIVVGHYIDFFLMIMPGSVKEHGGIGFIELGTVTIFASAFAYVIGNALTKNNLIAKNHPMIEESLHHSI